MQQLPRLSQEKHPESTDCSHVTRRQALIGPKVSPRCASVQMAAFLSHFALMSNFQRRKYELNVNTQSPEIIVEQAAEEGRDSREKQLAGGLLQTLSLMVSRVRLH